MGRDAVGQIVFAQLLVSHRCAFMTRPTAAQQGRDCSGTAGNGLCGHPLPQLTWGMC